MIGELSNHIWQSSLFACVAAMLAFALRRNRAHVRYWVWLTASLKFLIPFSLLISLGSHFAWTPAAKTIPSESVPLMIVQFTQPVPSTPPVLAPRPEHFIWLPLALLGVWACGLAVVIILRIREWLHIRAILRASVPLEMPFPIAARTSADQLEPGVVGLDLFGLSQPVLLLPAGLAENLTPAELEAVLSHELSHVRRRDNLTAATHMVVEALFWFHPFIWWIGARLLEERERACDEAVLSVGNEPRVYAESILNVCKLYTKSPSACVAGISGSNLKKRIEQIMRNQIGATLNRTRRVLLATAGLAALAIPIFAGALASARPQATSDWEAAAGGHAKFDVASVKQDTVAPSPQTTNSNIVLNVGDTFSPTGGLLSMTNYPLFTYIAFAYKDNGKDIQTVRQQLPGWAKTNRYDIIARAPANTTKDQFRLMMQTLLADRFKFAMHTETRQEQIFAMVLDKPGKLGPQLQQHTDTPPCSPTSPYSLGGGPEPTVGGPGYPAGCGTVLIGGPLKPIHAGQIRMGARNLPLTRLAVVLRDAPYCADRTVTDETGLTGLFDFVFEFARPAPNGPTIDGSNPNSEPDTDGPSCLEALKQQLGLKLIPKRGPVDYFVLDHIEEPMPN